MNEGDYQSFCHQHLSHGQEFHQQNVLSLDFVYVDLLKTYSAVAISLR